MRAASRDGPGRFCSGVSDRELLRGHRASRSRRTDSPDERAGRTAIIADAGSPERIEPERCVLRCWREEDRPSLSKSGRDVWALLRPDAEFEPS